MNQARIARNREAALQKRANRLKQQSQSQTQTQAQTPMQIDPRASTLTPMVNRMRVDSPNRSGTDQSSRAPLTNNKNTMNTNGSSVTTNPSSPIRRSTRKRTRQQYAEQQSV